ncbi:MAG: hypothetical protein JXM70_28970, partial [Pirellulales bacterium]|nr:hypothetical protein [Pirellulales bacterium]
MRPIALVTAVVLLGIFTSSTASQTQPLRRISEQPRAPEPPRHLPADVSLNAPNILRHENAAPRPLPRPELESRQAESWHSPPSSATEPAPT